MDAAAVVEPKPPVTPQEGVAEPKGKAGPSAVKEDTIVNRETKLALLIGFVAIVVVTVLVGEHFGKARNATPATTDMGTSNAAAPTTTGLTVDPITATPVSTPSAPVVPPVELSTTGANIAGHTAPVNPLAPTTPVNSDRDRFIPAAGIDTASANAGTPGANDIPGTQPVNTLGNTPAGGTTPPGFEAPQATKPVSTGVEKMHPVLKGETLATLAQKYYNDKALAKELGSYNAKRLSANGTVRTGVTLRIPPKDVLLGTAVLAGNAAGHTDLAPTNITNAQPPKAADKTKTVADKRATAGGAEKPATEKAKSGPRTYVIKKGDTLMSIASKELGSAKRWESLLVANPSINENSLRAGMTIKIPAK